jgi:predicted RNA-binding Zn ribbon-like protein
MDFLNSEWRDGMRDDSLLDRLDKPGWWNVMDEWGMAADQPLSGTDRERLKALRSWLRNLVEKLVQGVPLIDEDMDLINSFLQQVPVRRKLVAENGRYRWILTPDKKDWRWVEAEIIASFAGMLTEHDPSRIRICENQQCLWVFYDESKNRSRRWCDNRTCGNRMNVRKHRQRRRQTKGGRPEDE